MQTSQILHVVRKLGAAEAAPVAACYIVSLLGDLGADCRGNAAGAVRTGASGLLWRGAGVLIVETE